LPKRKGGGAPKGNKNAAGRRNGLGKGLKANAKVTYDTGSLWWKKKNKTAKANFMPSKGATTFLGKGLPGNSKNVRLTYRGKTTKLF
jgi:hypothetical protein